MATTQQPSLFDAPAPLRARLSLDEAKFAGELGMREAAAHADSEVPRWQDRAYRLFLEYAGRGEQFMAEDAVEWAEDGRIEAPPDRRAWGAVTQRAIREKAVTAVGFGRARTSHGSPKALYVVAVREPVAGRPGLEWDGKCAQCGSTRVVLEGGSDGAWCPDCGCSDDDE